MHQVAEAFSATHDGLEFVSAICGPCSTRLRRLPTGTRHKALNRAAANAAGHPDRYPFRSFPDKDAAVLFTALGAAPGLAAGVVEELMQ